MFFLVFILGIVTWAIWAISWWGWLIAIPALMLFWLPPQMAIATSKFGWVGMSIWAIIKFRKEKKIIWKISLPLCIIAVIWWYIWAHIVISINTDVLTKIVWILLLVLLPVVLWGNIWIKSSTTSLIKRIIWTVMYFFISILWWFFGGIWPLFMANLMYFFWLDIIQANATDFVPYLVLSITAMVVLIQQWFLDRGVGISLLIGMTIGWYVGAHLAVKKWTKRVKIVFAIVVVASAVKILFF